LDGAWGKNSLNVPLSWFNVNAWVVCAMNLMKMGSSRNAFLQSKMKNKARLLTRLWNATIYSHIGKQTSEAPQEYFIKGSTPIQKRTI
jgi:hypothetical protein